MALCQVNPPKDSAWMATGVAMKTLRVACAGLGLAISCSLTLGALTGCSAPEVGASSASAAPSSPAVAVNAEGENLSANPSSSDAKASPRTDVSNPSDGLVAGDGLVSASASADSAPKGASSSAEKNTRGAARPSSVSADVPADASRPATSDQSGSTSPRASASASCSDSDASSARFSQEPDAPRPSAASTAARKVHPSAACSSEADRSATRDGSGADASDADACATPTPYCDGTYYASGEGKFGPVPVTVVIEGGLIARIDVGANQETAAMVEHVCAQVVPDIIEAQSTSVDTIAGATVTSDAIIDAVNQALERARR